MLVDVVPVGVADPVAVDVDVDDLVGFGDVVGFVVSVGFGSATGLGAAVDGCSTVLLGDEMGVACCIVLCEGLEADVLRCCPVSFPARLSWPVIWPLTYRPAAAARAHSVAVMPAAMRRRRLASVDPPWAPPGSPSSERSALV